MSRFIGEQMHCVRRTIEKLHIRQSDDSPEGTVTQQYGFLKFDENEPDKTARFSQYIHLALKTDAETIVQFMREAWRLPTPDLIISVTGGAKHFDLPARLRKAFQLGLVSVAATTNAWIITTGTNAGVVKEVGEALNKYRYTNQRDGLDIPCIGIASWGYTAGKDQLDRSLSTTNAIETDSHENLSPKNNKYSFGIEALQMSGEAAFGMRSYVVREQEDKRCDLEPNHTHFLLLDDGTAKSENILPLRAEIEMRSRHINSGTTCEEIIHTLTPIVMVLLEGGRSAIQCICEALDSNTPVVVVQNSGRAADLVAQLYAKFSEDIVDYSTDNDDPKDDKRPLYRKSFARTTFRLGQINTIFARFRTQNHWVDNIRDDLCRVLNDHKQLVTIFNFDDQHHNGKLEEAILDAVFNAAKCSHGTNEQHRSAAELRLALAWHNADYARRAIFTDLSISKWTKDDIRLGLVDAIRRGYIAFIELFIEYGVTLEKITTGDLEYLYSTASIDEVLPLKKIKHSVPKREEFYADYIRNGSEIHIDKNVPLGEHAPRELFFWAIFLDRFDFAVYLCSKTWNQSVAPLFGARFYQKAAKITLDSETKHQYENNAKKLDKYAASIIDRCFDVDRDFAVALLNRPAVAFCNKTPLEVALKADCRNFLASRCVQRHLDNEWFGNINYKRQNINIRIFFCTLFFPLLPLFCGTLPYLRRHQSLNPNPNYRPKTATASTTYSFVNTGSIQWSEKIIYFYQAPIVRFYYNLIFFFVFLGLFSYVLLVDFFPLNTSHGRRSGIYNLPMPITEMWLHICIWGIITEELRQVIHMNSYGDYLHELSNLIDLSAIILYFIGFITRFIVIEEFFTISKIFLGFDLILWYIRILHLFAAYEKLGPKLIMIFNTMKDLLFFVCFILIFLFGFSITSWALIMTPSQVGWFYNNKGELENVTISDENTHAWNWKLLRDVTNYGVWKVFGQVDLIESTNPYSAVAFILAILFVAISNVLLLNVLVALFNVTIENVQDQSHNLWRYQRYLIVNEFRNKSLLPPPFNTFYCICAAIIRFLKCRRQRYRDHRLINNPRLTIDVHDITDSTFKITDSMQRESAIAEDFWRETLRSIEEKFNNNQYTASELKNFVEQQFNQQNKQLDLVLRKLNMSPPITTNPPRV